MPTYPQILAGRSIKASTLEQMLPVQLWKTANTDRPSQTTLADDPDLTTVLEANATYRVIFYLHYAALDAARFKTAWTVPSGAIGGRTAIGADQGVILSATSSGGTGRWGFHNYSTVCTYGTRDSLANLCSAVEEATLTTTSGGTLAIQWAQATSNATATRLAAGSSLRVERLS